MNNNIHSLPALLKGSSFLDERGSISFVNSFTFPGIKRFYIIEPKDTHVIRAWQAHKFETKYLFCINGGFLVATVKIDDFISPGQDLEAKVFYLKGDKPDILIVPGGHANGFKAIQNNSKLLVFSDKTLEQSKLDDYRFNPNIWVNWNTL